MKWKDFEGEKVRGIMEKQGRLYIYLQDKAVEIVSINKDYSWYDNWKINEEIPKKDWGDEIPERDSDYKTLQETVQEVWTDGYNTDTDHIEADMGKWIGAVGEGSWGAKPGEQYTFIKLKLTMREIEFGTVYHDCHYPSTVWEVIEQ